MPCRASHRSSGLTRRTRTMLLSCGDALVDFLPVTSSTGATRPCLLPEDPASTSPSAWLASARRRGSWAAFRPIFSDASLPTMRLVPRSTFAMRRAASIRRRLRSSVTWGASRNMRSMTRRRRPETGPIGRAPSPSTRSKRFMSDRRRLPTTTGQPRRWR